MSGLTTWARVAPSAKNRTLSFPTTDSLFPDRKLSLPSVEQQVIRSYIEPRNTRDLFDRIARTGWLVDPLNTSAPTSNRQLRSKLQVTRGRKSQSVRFVLEMNVACASPVVEYFGVEKKAVTVFALVRNNVAIVVKVLALKNLNVETRLGGEREIKSCSPVNCVLWRDAIAVRRIQGGEASASRIDSFSF
jgi:hypothetical protein